ncbi:MAG: hypothetical protein ABI769_14375 [Pseudomonadota bacterium]
MKTLRFPGLLVAGCFALGACGGDGGGGRGLKDAVPGATPLVSVTPEDTSDGWQTSTAEVEGFNSAALASELQTFVVLPRQHLVVVVTASNYDRNGPSMSTIRNAILPTLR